MKKENVFKDLLETPSQVLEEALDHKSETVAVFSCMSEDMLLSPSWKKGMDANAFAFAQVFRVPDYFEIHYKPGCSFKKPEHPTGHYVVVLYKGPRWKRWFKGAVCSMNEKYSYVQVWEYTSFGRGDIKMVNWNEQELVKQLKASAKCWTDFRP